jgi:uncharacterized protein YdhG (YjbR/CyaY superfamily)
MGRSSTARIAFVPKDKSAKQNSTPVDEADPRFIPVAQAFARTPGFSLMESKSGAMRGLMLSGKSFGMSSHGRFILKLTEERAAALIAEGIGKPFGPSPSRVMKGWIEVTDGKADWVALAREAHRIALTEQKLSAQKSKGRRSGPAASRLVSPSPGGEEMSKIDDYLAAVSGERRAALDRLRTTIRSIVPRAEECISYGMPAFRVDGAIVAGFRATAKGCSYYPFSGTTLRTLADDLRGYDKTKSALHFGPDEPLPAALVRKLIRARIAEIR